MTSISLQNLTLNLYCATRGLNKPLSAKGGFFLFGALRRKNSGRFSVGVLNVIVKFTSHWARKF